MSISGSLGFTKSRTSSIEALDKTVTVDEAELQRQTELQKQISEQTTQQITDQITQQITDQTTQQRTEQATEQVQKQISEQVGVTRTLDEQTQALIKDLIGQLSTGVGGTQQDALAELSTIIAERAGTAQADVTQQIGAITEDARLQGEQELQLLQQQLAQQAGGSVANTLVASATGVGRANLESQIARTRGELNLQARQVISDELASALTGITQLQAQQDPVSNIVNLLNSLKGAEVEQTQTGQQRATTTGIETGVSTGTVKGVETGTVKGTQTGITKGVQETTAESELSRLLDSLTKTKAVTAKQTKLRSSVLNKQLNKYKNKFLKK